MNMNHDNKDVLAAFFYIQTMLLGRCDVGTKFYKNGFVELSVSSGSSVTTWTIEPDWDEFRTETTLNEIKQKLGVQSIYEKATQDKSIAGYNPNNTTITQL